MEKLDDILIKQHSCYSKSAQTLSVLFSGLLFFSQCYTQVLFLHFAVKIDLKGGATCLLMVFHAILRQILKYRFCAMSMRELSVCDILFTLFTIMSTRVTSFKSQQHKQVSE